ncbi:MAG: hypothetical protein O3C43_15055 [Verrucomicrobia bacterium]|nr:hypothetical protein [Verrucomicrobiota bacterium]MDA1067809.1 hypothetical protein [Verrucomicrobiota bacterium]
MTIQELERYLSYCSNNSLLSFERSRSLIPDKLEVCEHVLSDGKLVELTLDRERGKMILEVYRNGDLVGEPLNFFVKSITDCLLGEDWVRLEPIDIIKRVLDRETGLRSA